MPHDILQSAISEVRDQLSLDYADDKYLNVVTGNLGLPRPVFGFTDAMWRAVVKELAIEHKQIRKKFYDVMAIMLGPAKTWCGTLKTSAVVGDEELVLNTTARLPQIGTLTLDEGTAAEETVGYHFIDRTTNTVYLDEPLANNHSAFEWDVEQPLIYDVAASETVLTVPWSTYFPTTISTPVTAVLSRGQSNEEVVTVSAHTTATGQLTISAATNSHHGFEPGVIRSTLATAYTTNSVYLSLNDTRKMPLAGYVMLGASSSTFTASAGTTTSVTVAAPSFTGNRLVGFKVKFTGNVTAALAGVESFITANSTTVLTTATLPVAPSAGDTFAIMPVLEYTSNDVDSYTLQLRRELPEELSFSAGTVVELLEVRGTVSLAPVKVQGRGWDGWDVLQVEPRHIEVLLPADVNDEADLRSASYLHAEAQTLTGLTLQADVSQGDTSALLDTTVDLPVAGVLTFDAGGGNEERVAFGLKWTHAEISAVASVNHYGNLTQTQLTVAGPLVASGLQGRYVFLDGHGYEVYDNTSTDIILTSVLPNHVLSEITVGVSRVYFFDTSEVLIPHGFAAAHTAAETVELYNPAYASTDLQIGDLYDIPDVFPGPYVYDNETVCVAGEAGPTTSLVQTLAKPTVCVVERSVGMTAIEVEDATSFPLSQFPYAARIGKGTGNRETININDVNLVQRVGNGITLTAGVVASPVAPTTLTVASTVASVNNGRLPNSNNYRILVGRGTVNEEVLVVTGTTGTAIAVQSCYKNHSIGETVELLNDVLTVDTLNDDHRGYVRYAYRDVRWPKITSTDRQRAELVEVLYSTVDVADTTGLPSRGSVVLNFGQQRMNAKTTVGGSGLAAGVTSVPLTDTNAFPTTYPYKITLGLGKYTQEIVTVTNNDVGTNTLTISHPTRFSHGASEVVAFVTGQSEVLEYTSLDAGAPGTLHFDTPVVVDYDHHSGEDVKVSLTDSEPRSLGYDFPLRMPPDILFRIGFLFDLIRAAGVKLTVIHKR